MSDKTEAPTPRRLEQAREEGQVARSLELNTAAIMLASVLLLQGPGRSLVTAIRELIVQTIQVIPQAAVSDVWLRTWMVSSIVKLGPSLMLLLAGILATGVAVTLAQTGFLWTNKKIGFDFKRINPISGFQRIFSKQGLIELARNLLKLALVGYVAYAFLRGRAGELTILGQLDLASAVGMWVDLAVGLALQVGGAYLVLAVADYAYQRWQYMRNMRMSKQEVKEDIKRSEGDPFLRGRIRAQQRKIARSRMMANVHKATVVVTNPTHFAVAIEYGPNMAAPRVVAKGAYLVAQRIVQIARSSGIPVVQNVPLARALYRIVEVDREIPPDLYRAVAEVLAYVYRLRGRAITTTQN